MTETGADRLIETVDRWQRQQDDIDDSRADCQAEAAATETREQRRARLFPQTAGGRCVGLSRAEVREERIAMALEALALAALYDGDDSYDVAMRKQARQMLFTIAAMRGCTHRSHHTAQPGGKGWLRGRWTR